MMARHFLPLVLFSIAIPLASARAAPSCGNGNFEAWLSDFKTEAAAKGIPQSAIDTGLAGVTLDQSVLGHDREQHVFQQSFEQFSGRMVPPRLKRGHNMMLQYGSALSRIETRYGVPGAVLVAIWGWRPTSGSTSASFPPSAPSPRWLMTAAAPICSGPNCSMPCASSHMAT